MHTWNYAEGRKGECVDERNARQFMEKRGRGQDTSRIGCPSVAPIVGHRSRGGGEAIDAAAETQTQTRNLGRAEFSVSDTAMT
ncbi:unnamed protein product [Lampetra fluviatilis]